ncbi:hypothetical protein ACFRMN_16290 [Streptomyces sp. NPDC056835]
MGIGLGSSRHGAVPALLALAAALGHVRGGDPGVKTRESGGTGAQ